MGLSTYSSSSTSSLLPKWAKSKCITVTTKQQQEQQKKKNALPEPSTSQSEYLMRIRSVRRWQERINNAQRRAWKDVVTPIVCQWRTSTSQPQLQTMDNGPPPTKKQRRQPLQEQQESSPLSFPNNIDLAKRYTLEPSRRFPLELVPCLVVSPPSCGCRLDRHALSEALLEEFQNNINNGCCRILLPRLLPTLQLTLSVVLRQCLNQEPSQALRQATRKLRTKRKRATSVHQSILFWATHTQQNYDSIVIVLEDPGGFGQRQIRQEFYQLLIEWRQFHGIPVSLVVIGNQSFSSYNMEEDDATLGRMRVQYAPLTLTTTTLLWMESFWKRLEEGEDEENGSTPLPLSFSSRERLYEETFLRSDSSSFSLGRYVDSLSQSLRLEFYRWQGSFVWDAVDSDPCFVAWFSTYSTSKELFFDLNGSHTKMSHETYQAYLSCENRKRELQFLSRLQQRMFPLLLLLSRCCSSSHNQTSPKALQVQLLPVLAELYKILLSKEEKENLSSEANNSRHNNSITAEQKSNEATNAHGNTKKKRKKPSMNLLKRYLDPTGRIEGGEDIQPPSLDLSKLQTLARELIIVVGQSHPKDNHNKTTPLKALPIYTLRGIHRMVTELHQLIGESMDRCMERWKLENPLWLEEVDTEDDNKTELVPRKDLVEGLSPPTKGIYNVWKDRLSISREDWYNCCRKTIEINPNEFTMGVWNLILLGLIQAKRGRGRGSGRITGSIQYEKVSVVWCS